MKWPVFAVLIVGGLVLMVRPSVGLTEYPRDVVKTIYVRNGGRRGDWQTPEFCPAGSYATAFSIKLETAMYASGDDTSLNGVRLTCQRPGSLDYYGVIDSGPGPWGYWMKPVHCLRAAGHEAFLVKFSLKVEPKRGNFRDDSVANNIKFQCRSIQTAGDYYMAEGAGGPWGTYGPWSATCGPKSAICGLQTRVESPKGPRDDTSLNDVRFFCCNDLLIFPRCTRRTIAGDGERNK